MRHRRGDGRRSGLSRTLQRSPGRQTNQALLVALVLAFGTGVATIAVGSGNGALVAIGHGIAGLAVVLLIPWKSRVVRAGLRRSRFGRWLSLLLAALAVLTLIAGIGYATGALRMVAGLTGMWWHIAFGVALVPLVLWHVVARGIERRRTDLSRRALLRTGVVGAGAIGLYAVLAGLINVLALPGSRRRFTGSYETGSFSPEAMPPTIWLADVVPLVDPDEWRLMITDGRATRQLALSDLAAAGARLRATLDCTSGWYSQQDWTGAPLAALLQRGPADRSVFVHAVTGYWVRFPIADLDHLLLATSVGGLPLAPEHGFPARLVAPDRRGYWWVKWVDRIELESTPPWWQPPFPIT